MYELRLKRLLIAFYVVFGVILAQAFALQIVNRDEQMARLDDMLKRNFLVQARRGDIVYTDGTPMATNEPGFRLEVAFGDLDDRMLPTLRELEAVFRSRPTDDPGIQEQRVALHERLARWHERRAKKGYGTRWMCSACGDQVKSAGPPSADERCRDCSIAPTWEELPRPTIGGLAALVERSPDDLRLALAVALGRLERLPDHRLHALLVGVPREAAEAIAIEPRSFAGFEAHARPSRWVDGPARTIVGGTRLPSREDLTALSNPDRAAVDRHVFTDAEVYSTLVGSSRLEAMWDDELRGVPGRADRPIVLKRGAEVETIVERAVQDGETLHTSISRSVQELANEIVVSEPRAAAASAVVLDVRTGAIVAMASHSGDGMDHARSNVMPGSVWKLITAVATLDSGISAEDTVVCRKRGSIPGGMRYKCEGHHYDIDLRTAFEKSCNGYFAQRAAQVGPDAMASAARRLGLAGGFELGLGTRDVGPAGLEWTSPDIEDERRRWFPTDMAYIGIGQGKASCSPLQLVLAYARLAADGRMIEPWLLERKRRDVVETDPVLARHAPVLQDAARRVVVSGTGRRQAALADVSAAGKSGTAEVGFDLEKNNTWFVGYAPHHAPRYAAVVVFEGMPTGTHGASEAGDPVGRLLAAALGAVRATESEGPDDE